MNNTDLRTFLEKNAFYSFFQNIFIDLWSKFQSHSKLLCRYRGAAEVIPTHSQPGVGRRWVVSITLRSTYRRERPGTYAGGLVGLQAGPDGTKNFAPSEFDPRLVHPIASRYIDWANSAAYLSRTMSIILCTALRLQPILLPASGYVGNLWPDNTSCAWIPDSRVSCG
jgi:hypothetical protein